MEYVNSSRMVPLSMLGPSDSNSFKFDNFVYNNDAGINFKLEFYNSTSFELAIIDRRNVKLVLPQTGGAVRGQVTVKATWNISATVRNNTLKRITSSDIENSMELNKMTERWKRDLQTRTINVHHRVFDEFLYFIDEDVLRRKKYICIRELDIVVCLAEEMDKTEHPHSRGGRLKDRVEDVRGIWSEIPVRSRRFFTLNIFIVDNADKIGTRWLNFHGSVRRIDTTKDPTSEDGFYVFEDREVTDGSDQSTRVSDFFKTEEELKFPLYKNYQAAAQASESESMYKLRILIEENRIKELELGTRAARAESDIQKLQEEARLFNIKREEAEKAHERQLMGLERELELEKNKFEAEREKFEQAKAQAEHDKATQTQKNFGDTVKTFGSIVTSVLALIVIFAKLLPTK